MTGIFFLSFSHLFVNVILGIILDCLSMNKYVVHKFCSSFVLHVLLQFNMFYAKEGQIKTMFCFHV